MKSTIQLSLISVALLSQLHAQDITLKPFEVTSTAIKTDELKSTDAVEVYTQDEIEKAHVQNVYEFLNQQTSVSALPSYGNPFTQKLDMHGYGSTNGNQNIVITLNGRKINNIDLVPQLLSAIAPSSIKRVEIIKSSGIVVGGDGANAGVINITTKQESAKEVSFYLGNYGVADGSFYVGHKDNKLAISATGEAQKSDGVRNIDADGNKDANSQGTGTFNLEYTPLEALTLRLGAMFSKSSVIYAGALTQAEYDADPTQMGGRTSNKQAYDTTSVNAGVSYYINDDLSLNIDASNEQKQSRYASLYTNTNVYNSLANYTYNTLKANLEYTTDNFSLITGVDAFFGERKSSSYSDFGFGASDSSYKTSKDNLAAFLLAKYTFGASSLKAGYRYETVTYKHSDKATDLKDDNALNGAELGYNYLFTQESSMFLDYAHSYQAPDIDRFFATSYPAPAFKAVVGFNGFIKPMKADSLTLGYNLITNSNKLKVALYYVDLTDEIYYEPVTYKNTNIDKSHKYGLDLYEKFLISQEFNIALNYNYVQAIIDSEKEGTNDYAGKKLPGVSDHNIKLTASYLPNEKTTLSLTQVYRSEAYASNDFNNNFSQKQAAVNSTDISFTYAEKSWEVFAKINNLFNQKNGLWILDDAIYPVNFTRTALAGFKLKY